MQARFGGLAGRESLPEIEAGSWQQSNAGGSIAGFSKLAVKMNGRSVKSYFGDRLLQNVSGMAQLSLFLLIEFEAKDLPHATAIEHGGKTQADAVDSVITID
jgi:hypothetical protein